MTVENASGALEVLETLPRVTVRARPNGVPNAITSWPPTSLLLSPSSAELKEQVRSASIISAQRAVFNIKGNDYRLVVGINYRTQAIFIKWLGTHAEYDRIDVATVRHEEERYGNLSDHK